LTIYLNIKFKNEFEFKCLVTPGQHMLLLNFK